MAPTRKPKQSATLVTPPGFNADARDLAELDEEIALLRVQLERKEQLRRLVMQRLNGDAR